MRHLYMLILMPALLVALASGCAKKPLCETYRSCCKLVKGQGKDVSLCASVPASNDACSNALPQLLFKVRKVGGTQLHGMCKKLWKEALDSRK